MSDFLASITRSLGRTSIQTPPPPPRADPSVARLQGPDDIVAVFRRRATDAKMNVIDASEATLANGLVELLRARGARSVVLAPCTLFSQLELVTRIRGAEIKAANWTETTLDATYDVDAGITDVYRAIAETGSIVVRESVEHGRAVSLVPPIHIAVVRKSQIVPDLLDLMADVSNDGSASGIVIITGPSKTADIEMNLVTGVHGPGEVHIFLID